jgi:sirohydrochlorin cobaltochelatase
MMNMHQALLTVSFGTSIPEARESIQNVERALQQAVPERSFFRAFSSPPIRRILSKRGEIIFSLPDALAYLRENGVQDVIVQPTHILYGFEYDEIQKTVQQFEADFLHIALGKPLLADSRDLQHLTNILSQQYPEQEKEALVLMGHGTTHFANLVYPALQTAFRLINRTDVFIGTVEGWPDLNAVKLQLKNSGYHNLHLVPLMLVAGNHVKNDMIGEHPGSWKSQLETEGFSVRYSINSLGMMPEVQKMYVEHVNKLLLT